MHLKPLSSHSSEVPDIDRILRHQLQWMLLLRIILYTLLLAVIFFLGSPEFKIIVLPRPLLILLFLAVYTSSIASAFTQSYLSFSQLRNFAFIQNLLDTLFASILVYFTGASHSIFTAVYFFPIISGGLITPRKGGIIAAAASTLQYGLILGLEYNDIYPDYFSLYNFVPVHSLNFHLEHFAAEGLTFFLAALLSALFGIRQRKTEAALTQTIRSFDKLTVLYKRIFDNINTGIITLTENDIITSANPAATQIIGFTPAFLIGKKIREVFPNLQLQDEAHRLSADLEKSDGTKIRIGYSLSRLPISEQQDPATQKDEDRKLITLRDIGEIEKLEHQLRQREKMAAIGMMSAGIAHDFRNPLTAISGSAQVLAAEFSGDESGEDRTNYELAAIIVRESNRLIETIADFLKFARPERADRSWFSLHSCLSEVLQVCRADQSWPNSSKVNMNFDEKLDVWADERQFFTAFSHLLSNAIVFCPPAQEMIEIEVNEQEQDNGKGEVVIEIGDNGPGIPEHLREKIFEPFFTQRADGTGLGLAIVRQTVHEHQGTIEVGRSKLGGALFTIRLPLP
jgi:two-component system, NtrC family, sensor histidine kinase PilS